VQLDEIARLIDTEVSTGEIMANIEAVQSIDRYFTYPKFAESARLVVKKLADYGLEARFLEQPADGTSRLCDWVMPLAWDCGEATLELLAPEAVKGKVLCRRSEDPNVVVMWSAPTGAEGVTAEVVGPLVIRPVRGKSVPEYYIAAPGETRPVRDGELAGKIVYTSGHPQRLKHFLVKAQVAGVISSYSPRRKELPHNRFWVNSWADDPGGWAFTARDTPLWCFVLTPAQGEDLEALLAAGPVKARAVVESRLYEGVLPAATGLLRGASNEEILTLGHQFEIGADDNASAVAVMMECGRVLAKLISEEKLPVPHRSLRYLFMNECYGSIGWAAMNPRLARRTLAAVNLDCVGGDQRRTEMPLPVSLTPGANPSVADTLIGRLCRGYLHRRDPYFSWYTTAFTPCDSTLGDPMIGIPVVYLGGKDKFWHTTADTIDKIDPEAAARVTVLAAALTYYLAAAGSPEAEWLAEEAAADGRRDLARLGSELAAGLRSAQPEGLGRVLTGAAERLTHLREVAAGRVRSAQAFAARTERREFRAATRPMLAQLKKQAKLEGAYLHTLAGRLADEAGSPPPEPQELERPAWWAEAQKLIPVRRVPGTITLDGIPAAQREGYTSQRWVGRTTNILFRCDGGRTLAEAVLLGSLDDGATDWAKGAFDYVKFFRFLERHDLVELRPVRKKVLPVAMDPTGPHD